MSLLATKVPRSLDSKPHLFGFELGDLLLVFMYLAFSNLLFGNTRFKFPVVWIGTFSLGVTLHFVKKGKPDNYLQHLLEFWASPGIYSAGTPDTEYRPYIRIGERNGGQR